MQVMSQPNKRLHFKLLFLSRLIKLISKKLIEPIIKTHVIFISSANLQEKSSDF